MTIKRILKKQDEQDKKLDKLLEFSARTEQRLLTINGTVDKHEKRIGSAEIKIYMAMGGLGIISVLGSMKALGLW